MKVKTLSDAQQLDVQDPLRAYRERFFFPRGKDGKPKCYFCGNSLGLQLKEVPEYVERELKKWQDYAVEGHFLEPDPWFSYHELLTEPLADIVGALPKEVVAMNSLTVNLHLLLVSFYRPTSRRYKILTAAPLFPSDLYALQSQVQFHGLAPEEALVILRPKEHPYITLEQIQAVLEKEGERIALVFLEAVNYYTGQWVAMEAITKAAHRYGCLVGFDLAHAIGNVPMQLHDWGVDFAVWCSYKYLNGGPGTVGGCFIHERHLDKALPRFAGWWGHNKQTRFAMPEVFDPIPSAEAWQLSNAPIMAMACLRPSLYLFQKVGMYNLRKKSEQLTNFLVQNLLDLNDERLTLLTPLNPSERGAQVSIAIKEVGKKVYESLIQHDFVVDWRSPNCIRVAPVPFYNTFEEVFRFVQHIKATLAQL